MKGILQFIRFGIVGFINTIISYGIYAMVIFFFGNRAYILGSILGFVISVLSAFILSSRFVFTEEEGKEKRIWWKVLLKTYASYAFTGLLLSNLLLYMWIDVINLSRYMSPAVGFMSKFNVNMDSKDAAAYAAPLINLLVTIPLNFIINKFWAYRQKEN